MFSQEAFEKILGINEVIQVTPREMADKLNITFYPYKDGRVSKEVLSFAEELRNVMTGLKVNIVPYKDAMETVPYSKIIKRFFKIIFNNLIYLFQRPFHFKDPRNFIPLSALKNLLRRKKIKRGISVIALGEGDTWNLPMDHTTSFTQSSVITLVDWPNDIKENSSFLEHFDKAMGLFAYHMTNIIIAVSKEKWLLYNFNASHPVYSRGKDFSDAVLWALIPKVVAPIRPHKFSEFIVEKGQFDINDSVHKPLVDDLLIGAKLFHQTNLYPPGKKIADLPFRNDFYKWIGSIHLDERSGMSFGFLARQLPTSPNPLFKEEVWIKTFSGVIPKDKDYFVHNDKIFLVLSLSDGRYIMAVPDVWVLSQRSGCDKTNFIPGKDLVKLGLKNGRMYIQTPQGLSLSKDYKTSFDTKVILAHALGNAIISSILSFYNPKDSFSEKLSKHGLALAHWHGYFNPKLIPSDFYVYGINNPHVSCSSPQSAIYAITGKLEEFSLNLKKDSFTYVGDVHIEPHHGTNISFSSLRDLAEFLLKNPTATVLGNKYLDMYNL